MIFKKIFLDYLQTYYQHCTVMTTWARIFFTNSKESLFKNIVAATITVTFQCHFMYSEMVIFSSDMLEHNSENYTNVQNYKEVH